MENTSNIYTSCMMPLSARCFFINVSRDEDECFFGTISQTFYKLDISFKGLDDAILKIDHMLDELGCVQASVELRRFNKEKYIADKSKYCKLTKEERIKEEKKRNTHIQYREIEELREKAQGQLNCFVVEILYRQHSSWQGNIIWRNHLKQPKRERFRSVLELMRLISSSYDE